MNKTTRHHHTVDKLITGRSVTRLTTVVNADTEAHYPPTGGATMEFDEIINTAKTRHGLSQNKLAERIGLNKSSMSAVIHGRRPLPAEAAIELFDLTGIHPRDILKAASRTMSCLALALVVFLSPVSVKNSYASNAYYEHAHLSTNYRLFRRRSQSHVCTLKRPLFSKIFRALATAGACLRHEVWNMINACTMNGSQPASSSLRRSAAIRL